MPPTTTMPSPSTSTPSSASTAPTPFIVNFYDPTSPTKPSTKSPFSRTPTHTLLSILSYTDSELEHHHDYIQLLFPLPERSLFNPSAPIVTEEVFQTFRSRPDLRAQLERAFTRMAAFYGFDYTPTPKEGTIVPIANPRVFENNARKTWLRRFGHNHLRITRILRSLRVLGCEELARTFLSALREAGERYPGVVGERSWGFWERAVERELWMAPEDEEGVGVKGEVRWLWEWERGKKGEVEGGG